MILFNDLPDEILEIIVGYIPHENLEDFLTNPIIGKFAFKELYSPVVIHNGTINLIKKLQLSTPHSKVLSTSRFIKLIEKNSDYYPKRIIFERPNDVFEVAEKFPNLMRKSSVEICFIHKSRKPTPNRIFIEKYKEVTIDIDSIITNCSTESLVFFPIELFTHVNSFSQLGKSNIRLNKLSSNWFPKLSSLTLIQEIDYKDLILIPRQLETLECTIGAVNENHVDLALPENLRKLRINTRTALQDIHCIFDISHLKKVQNLHLNDEHYRNPLNRIWNLPRNVKFLRTNRSDMVDIDLAKICPQLVEWQFDNETIDYDGIFIRKLIFPRSMKRLKIPNALLSWNDMASGDEGIVLNLPDSLTELNTTGQSFYPIILDFDQNPLPHLQVLIMNGGVSVSVKRSLPKSLRKLNWESMNIFDLNQLQYLDNLTELCISCSARLNDFSYILPLSLVKLELRGLNLKKIDIKASHLLSVTLFDIKLKQIDNRNLCLPNSIIKLHLMSCGIENIAIAFPPRLLFLDLSGNRIKSIDGHPCDFSELENISPQTFPTSLTHLNLSHNKIDTQWIYDLNLRECKNLKSLDLDDNEISILVTTHLPLSLKKLSLNHNKISTLVNDFEQFQNLEELDLRDNHLHDYFDDLQRCGTFLFGENIQCVYLELNSLTIFSRKTLFDHLSQRKSFEELDIVKPP